MSLPVRHLPRFVRQQLGWLALGAVLPLVSPATDWQSLLANSPFGQTTTPVNQNGELEFRGIVQEGSHFYANLYDSTTKKSEWIPVSGSASGLTVNSYDSRSDVLSITHGGRKLSLPLKISRISKLDLKPAPVAANTPPAAPNEPPDLAERRREIREWRRQVASGENPGPPPFYRNLPPEAQAMIQEIRRRRQAAAAERQGEPAQTQPTVATPAPGPLPLPEDEPPQP
jgi:hypothetical protein